MKLKLGLVGLSSDWRKRYLPSLRVLQERFEVAGVYCSVASVAESVAREFEAERYDGYREMLKNDNIDALMMLSSDWYGLAPIHAACDLGKAVYCGSEIDFDPQAAAVLSKLVDQSGIAFMAEFPRRYAPASLRLKELIATRLGQPQLLFCHRRLTCETDEHGRNMRGLPGRASRELMELIDWCSYIVGRRPRSIQATAHQSPIAAEHVGSPSDVAIPNPVDYQVLSIDYSAPDAPASTVMAQVSCGSYIRPTWHEAITFRPPAAVQVCCEKGVAFVDLPSSLTWFDDAGRHQESLESELAVGQQLLTQFHRAVTSLVRKMGDLEDVTCSLRTLQAAQQSIAQRCVVDLG